MSYFGTAANDKKGGRRPLNVCLEELKRLRAQGISFRMIGQALGIGTSTAFYLWRDGTTPRGTNKPVQKPASDDFAGQPEAS